MENVARRKEYIMMKLKGMDLDAVMKMKLQLKENIPQLMDKR